MCTYNNSFRRTKGFTLIELMITLVIVGILASVALPSYRQYVIKANRTSAKQFLMSVTNRQEQYLLDNRTYAGTLTALGMTPPPELAGKYNCTLQNITANPPAYEAVCTAQGSQLSDGNLTINQAGTKSPADKW